MNDEIMKEFKFFNSKEICGIEDWLNVKAFCPEVFVLIKIKTGEH